MMQPLLQVMGLQRSAADVRLPSLVYGWPVLAPIGCGEVLAIELADVHRHRAVLAILTADSPLSGEAARFADLLRTLLSPAVTQMGQVVALVVAETRQAAQRAAGEVRLRVRAKSATLTVSAALGAGLTDPPVRMSSGQAAESLVSARTWLKQTYRTAPRLLGSSPSGVATAVWRGDAVTVYAIGQPDPELASYLKLSSDKLLSVMSAVGAVAGGGRSASLLAAIAAAHLDRPVRVELPALSTCGVVAETVQTLQLGLDAEARPLAFLLHGAIGAPVEGRLAERAVIDQATCYGFAHRELSLVPVRLSLPMANRRSGVSGWPEWNFSVEVAIDELASQLDTDPLMLRQRWLGDSAMEGAAALRGCLKQIQVLRGRGHSDEESPVSSRDASLRMGHGVACAVHRTESGALFFGAHSMDAAVVDGRVELRNHRCVFGVRPASTPVEAESVVLRSLEQARKLALQGELVRMPRSGWTTRTGEAGWRSTSVLRCEVEFVSPPNQDSPLVADEDLACLVQSGVSASVINALSAALGTRLRSLPPTVRVAASGAK